MRKYKILFIIICFLFLLLNGCKSKMVTVTFIGNDEEIISSQVVEVNSEIIYPEAPIIDGGDFIEWDNNITIATEDITIKAIYDIYTYKVKFYDYFNKVLDEQIVEYGKSANPPQLPITENYVFIKWDKDYSSVKENMKIYPIFEKEYYTVTFLDINDEIIEEQKVKNGENAIAPTPPEIRFYSFIKWDKEFSNVKDDITVKAIYEAIGDYDMNDVNYWLLMLSKKYDIENILMSYDDIKKYNQKVTSDYDKTLSVDVNEIKNIISDDELKQLINQYTNINKYQIYNDQTNKIISANEKQLILDNRNINNISKENIVRFGIVTDFAWVRSYPTNYYSNDYTMDRFQETSLNVGEGVAIYHQSLDNNWYYVQAMNYNGWVEKKYIAESSKDEMSDFLNANDKVVVISNYVTINNKNVRMGQSFPLINEDDSHFEISFPIKTEEGLLQLQNIKVNKDENYNKGYLEYTYENVFKQGFKLLGINYSWGDKEVGGRDCSSNTASIYKSFGFMLPRNTTEQMSVPSYSDQLNGINDKIIKENYKPGTLIYTSSHVMIYIGENESGESYLLHNTNANQAGCILQSLSSYGGYKMIYALRLQ